MLSGDGDFTKGGVGEYSEINYKEYFAAYKRIIIAARGSEWYAKLLSTWQKAVFPRAVATVEATQTSEAVGPQGEKGPEDARKIALGNELSEFLQHLTISGEGINATPADLEANTNDSVSGVNANNAASEIATASDAAPEAAAEETPEVAASAGQGADDNSAGDPSHADSETDKEEGVLSYAGSEHRSVTEPVHSSNNGDSASISRSRRAPRPSITDTEPDVPPAPAPPRTLRRTYSFIDESTAVTPPLSSRLTTPTLMQHPHSESTAQVAPQTTSFISPSAQLAVEAPAPSNADSMTIPAAGPVGANRRGRSSKNVTPKQALDRQTTAEMPLQASQVAIPRTRRSQTGT